MLLEVEALSVSYGRARALEGLCLSCDPGETVCLVGPNGAGKTSAMMAIAGVPGRKVTGRIRIDGLDVTGAAPETIARMGLSLVPEARRTFSDLTVRENLLLGARRLPARERRAALEKILARLPALERLADRQAGKLSGGEQQILVIARAMIGKPRLLLLDEPSLGLAPLAIREVYEQIGALVRDSGLGLILVEQNALAALAIADRCIVLRSGRVEMAGDAQAMRNDSAFLDAYFGVSHGEVRA